MTVPSPQALPLTDGQRAIWLAGRARPTENFMVSQVTDIVGPADADQLAAAVARETAELTIASVHYSDDQQPAVMQPGVYSAEPDRVDFRDETDPEAAAWRWIDAREHAPVVFADGATRYSAILTIGDERHLIYCQGHHLSYDGYSAGVVASLQGALYSAASRGDELPALPAVDLGVALREEGTYRHSSDLPADRAYWKRATAGAHAVASMSGRYRAASSRGVVREDVISADLVERLGWLSERTERSLSSVLGAAILGFQARITGATDQTMLFPVTARVTPEQLGSPVPHSNMVPLRVEVGECTTAAELLAGTSSAIRGALRHQRYRYEDIVAELGPRETRALCGPRGIDAPQLNLMLFDHGITFDGCAATYKVFNIGPIDDVAYLVYYGGAHRDLSTLRIGFRANPDRYTDAELDEIQMRLHRWVFTFVTALLDESRTPVHDLPVLSYDEEQGLEGVIDADRVASERSEAAYRDHRRAIIVDPHGHRMLPPGIVGEVLVSPPDGQDGTFSASGHRARWKPETISTGTPVLEYAGHVDDVIDLGDNTVDLYALDDLVQSHPSVAAAASTWASGELTIHVALHPKSPADIRQLLTEHLIRALPRAVRPDRLELLDSTYLGVVTALRITRRGANGAAPLEIAARGSSVVIPGVDLTPARASVVYAETSVPLRAVADANRMTLVHTALAAYVGYAGGTRDLVVGTPDPAASNRFAPTDALAAHTDIPLPLRSQVRPDMTFSAAVESVTLADNATRDDALRRAAAEVDVLDVHLTATARPTYALNLADLGETPHPPAVPYGLDFQIVPDSNAELALRLRYPTSAVDAGRAEEIVGAVAGLVESGLADPTRTIGELLAGEPVVDDSPAAAATLGEILEAALGEHRDLIALEDFSASPPVQLTYGDLAVAAGEVARELLARGVGPGDVVALHLGRSAYSVICTVAAAWVGAAFVQLNPDDPVDRKLAVIGESGARVVLGWQAGELPGLEGLDTPVHADRVGTERSEAPYRDHTVGEIVVRREWAIPQWLSFNTTPTLEPFADVPVDSVAYLTFTSGTTGAPKGVAVTHRGLLPWVQSVTDAAQVTADSRVLHNYSVVFDAHLIEVIPTLAAGATIVVCPPEIIGGNELRALLETREISTFFSTPSVLATVESPGGGTDLQALKTVVVGGESLSPALAAPWAVSRRLVNFYGPTETTVAVTGDAPVDVDRPIAIGTPLAAVTAHVLDARLRPMPANAIGELYIAGPSLARGYVGQSGQTATRFVADPFTPGARMYRTGDRVHRASDGRLVIHGRVDEQIKLHGIRIEPAEINTALLRIPGVRDAYTALAPDHAGEQVLVSWIVTHDVVRSGAMSGDAIRSRLREFLPRTYLPTAVVPVDAFPLTANGKVDHRTLPDWRAASLGGIAANDLEEVVLKHFRAALGAESIGVRDNFFTLGGDSLRAVEAAGAIEREIGRLVPVRLFFDYSTARALAGVLTEESTYNSAVATMGPADVDGPVPMAPFQARFWFLHSAFPTSPAYLVPMFLPTPADASREEVADAVNALVVRHDTLRTIYANGASGPTMQILDSLELDLPEIDPHDSDAVNRHLTTPFDLSAQPPVRVAFIEGHGVDGPSGVGRGVFLVVHHLIADRESVVILQRELAALLRGETLPELGYTYADTARWHIDLLHGLRPELLEFWERQLRGFGAMELSRTPIEDPTQRPPIITVDKVYHHGITLTHEQHVGISDVARRLGATEFHVLHAALALTIAAQANTEDVLVVAPTTLRHRLRGGDLVGAFITGVLLRTTLTADADADGFVQSIKNNDVICFDNALIPVEEIGMRIDFTKLIPGHLPVQVGFTYDVVDDLYPLVTDDEASAALSELELHVTAARSATETQLVFGCADPLVRSEDGWMLIERFRIALDMLLAGGVIDYGRLRLSSDRPVPGGPEDRFARLAGVAPLVE